MSDLIGLIAASLTTLSFLPQALMVIRTRKADGISLVMYAMFTAGVAGWLVYGLMTGSIPIIVANAVTLALAGVILIMKIQGVTQARKHESASAVLL